MKKRVRAPIWIHIDHLDNPDGRVWAIQIPSKKKYFTVHSLDIRIGLTSRVRKTQPRAYLVGKARQVKLHWVDGKTVGVIE